MDEDTANCYLLWKGAPSGPHSLRDIRSMLKRGKINSLYKIKVNGDWILLRDHLADIDRMERATGQAPPPLAATPVRGYGSSPDDEYIQAPKVLADDHVHAAPPGAQTEDDETVTADASMLAKGFAITSFVLALFFFIPIVNYVTGLLALLFGHIALAKMGPHYAGKPRSLVVIALLITYVQAAYLALSAAWVAIAAATTTAPAA